jgi:YD repeat-containing protein
MYDGYSCERIYDDTGREKAFKDSRGCSYEYTYDEFGNQTIKES